VASAAPSSPLGAPETLDPLIGLFVDRDRQFQVISFLGAGGFGRVYKGRQESMGRYVAIKTLHRELLGEWQLTRRFKREALALARVRSPFVVSVFILGEIEAPGEPYDGTPYMVMEYISDGSLAQWIEHENTLGPLYEGGAERALRRILELTQQVARGLYDSHQEGVIHQDVKPENVLLTSTGQNDLRAKVSDFGLAGLLVERRPDSGEAGFHGMTAAFCSPEQAQAAQEPPHLRREKLITSASDVWSWGLLVLAMFNGGVSWVSGIAAPEILDDILLRGPQAEGLPRVPDRLAPVLRECFRATPEERPDLGRVLSALESL
jgi:serine/threonine protein kinase